MSRIALIICMAVVFTLSVYAVSFAACGACGPDAHAKGSGGHEHEKKGSGSCFGDVCAVVPEKGGVREISYEQFQKIRASGEEFVLLDALSAESYAKGHIEGAVSFPYAEINHETAPKRLAKADKIIVYCGGFKCSASTKAAHRLQALGYENVVDYKGGLEEWQAKGHDLVE